MAVMPVGVDGRSLACAERAGCDGDAWRCRKKPGKRERFFSPLCDVLRGQTTTNKEGLDVLKPC